MSEPANPPVNLLRNLEQTLSEADVKVHDLDIALAGVRAMLRLAGEDPERSGLLDTPDRVLRAWMELTSKPGDPETLLSVMFDDAGRVDQMVAVGPIPFTSMCEHHLLPFNGIAWIAYIPEEGVVGLSKLPRLLEHYARRPQVQERLTAQITEALNLYVSKDAACVIKAAHSCASSRGVRKESPMTTSSLTGAFKQDPTARAEFMTLAFGG